MFKVAAYFCLVLRMPPDPSPDETRSEVKPLEVNSNVILGVNKRYCQARKGECIADEAGNPPVRPQKDSQATLS